ncbi:MAG: DUF456 domain-containing protein [Anaerolineales bacterium]|nr:DUF456 domain-containing protein [Anaerolineales bacterium]MCX7607743.1 DUF456 domain-containing protein [Anaerolineales bacterium]MDW8226316.1 DUF456 domain-containing protein [Anaerolineales bacterium]
MTIGPYYIHLDLVLQGFILTVMLVGLLITPILPGLLIIWAAALVYGLIAGFGVLGWVMFVLITILMIVGSVLDNVLMGASAYKEGAPWWVILLALIATVAGGFFIPLPIIGGVSAGLATLFLVEWIRRKNAHQAWTSVKAMLAGWSWAALFRSIIALVMIVLWVIWAWV